MPFDEFWAIYPRHVAKKAARIAWDKALKLSTEDKILEGALRYALERQGKDQQFTAHGATWLNGERWNDEASGNSSSAVEACRRIEQRLNPAGVAYVPGSGGPRLLSKG